MPPALQVIEHTWNAILSACSHAPYCSLHHWLVDGSATSATTGASHRADCGTLIIYFCDQTRRFWMCLKDTWTLPSAERRSPQVQLHPTAGTRLNRATLISSTSLRNRPIKHVKSKPSFALPQSHRALARATISTAP